MIHHRTFLASSMAQFASEPQLLPLRDQDEVFLVPGTQAVLVLDPGHSSSLRSQGHDRWIWCDPFQCWIYTPDAHVTDEYLRVLEREHFDVPPDQTQNLKRDRWLHVIALVRHQGRELERVRRRAADLERRLQLILDVGRGLRARQGAGSEGDDDGEGDAQWCAVCSAYGQRTPAVGQERDLVAADDGSGPRRTGEPIWTCEACGEEMRRYDREEVRIHEPESEPDPNPEPPPVATTEEP